NLALAINHGYLNLGDLTSRGVTQRDLSHLLDTGATFSGKYLNTLSQVKRQLGLVAKAYKDELEAGTPDELLAREAWARFSHLYRALMVGQVMTHMRNLETQVGRVGLDTLQGLLDSGIRMALGLPSRGRSPLDGFEKLVTTFDYRKTKADAEEILSHFPKAHDKLLLSYSSDIVQTYKALGMKVPGRLKPLVYAEDIADLVNTTNRLQEYFVRRGVFQADLAQSLRLYGIDLG